MQLAGGGAMDKKWGKNVLEKAALLRFLAVICCRSNFIASCLVLSCSVAGDGGCLCSRVGKAAWFLGAAVLYSVIKKHASRFNFLPVFP